MHCRQYTATKGDSAHTNTESIGVPSNFSSTTSNYHCMNIRTQGMQLADEEDDLFEQLTIWIIDIRIIDVPLYYTVQYVIYVRTYHIH